MDRLMATRRAIDHRAGLHGHAVGMGWPLHHLCIWCPWWSLRDERHGAIIMGSSSVMIPYTSSTLRVLQGGGPCSHAGPEAPVMSPFKVSA
jgi:hypothetical protein